MGSEKFLRKFGIKIRELRIKKGWTRKDLARHAGLSAGLISSVEKGRMDISLRIILQLMEGLGYTDDELLTSNI
jgi:transcriptional regulator with XRE-family HTH domain